LKIGDIIYPNYNNDSHYHLLEKDKDGYNHHIHLHSLVVEALLKIFVIEETNEGIIEGEDIRFKCKKSLYKSTYKHNAFTKGKYYELSYKDDKFFYIKDNTGREFSVAINNISTFYWVEDYFDINKKL
jgi:hypothetical protein